MKRGKEKGLSNIDLLSQGVRDSEAMKRLATKIQAWAAGIRPGRLRWLCFGIVVGGLAAGLLVDEVSGPADKVTEEKIRHFRLITLRRAEREGTFHQEWDSVMANPALKKDWDSLLKLRPGLADTVEQLRAKDSIGWGW